MSTRQTRRSLTAGSSRTSADALRPLTTDAPGEPHLSRRRLLQATGLGAVGLGTAGALSPDADAAPAPAEVAPLDGGDLKHYTGQFHSHTGVSSDHATTRGEPIDAWRNVAAESDLDFFAVTEHDVTYDVRNADIETTDWRDAVSQEWRLLHEQAEEFNKDVETTGLIAIPGTEHTWYDYSGHSNSFNTDFLVTAQSGGDHKAAGLWGIGHLMFDLPMFYARLAEAPGALAQFNHPNPDSGGNFFDFTHLTPEADSCMNTIEVRADDAFRHEYTLALDAGWHVAPVYGDDEHHDRWGENDAVTGIWATEQSEDALYAAFRNRSLYVSKDRNAQLMVRGNGEIMGSILDGDTTSLELRIQAMDPDPEDSFATLIVRSNGGDEVHTAQGLGREVDETVTLEVADGDYYWVELLQEDGDALFSAPIWIGERVAGAHYAPDIELLGRMPSTADEGQSIPLPRVRHKGGGGRPDIEITVYTGAGEVEHDGSSFTVSGYDDHYVVVRASDDQGSTAAKYYRLQVNQEALDPEAVFRHFTPTVSVGAGAGEVGIAVSTDVRITTAHLQHLPADSEDWDGAPTVATVRSQVYEVVREGRDGEDYIDRVGGQPLRAHDLDLSGLEPGRSYRYRLGVSESGPWTEVLGTFTVPSEGNAPLYVLGDLEANSGDEGDHALFTGMLDVLRAQDDRGAVLVQTGDLIGAGDRAEWWDGVSEHVLRTLDIPLAPVVGDGETGILDEPDGDKEFDDISSLRNAIFRGMYNTPGTGSAVGESNYSFDQGDVHVAVLNGRYDLKLQLDWLAEDMHASDATWRIVVGHYSYYGGAHADDFHMSGDRAMITDAFDRLGVDLYVGGHDHLYKRTTITEGKVAETPEEVAFGTTFVTVGSAGPSFDDNQKFWWDDVVFEEDVQTGLIIDATEGGLRLRAFDANGGSIDDLTIGMSERDDVRLSSAEVTDGELVAGLIGYAGSPEQVVVTAETTDASGSTVIESRTATVTLTRTGGEQAVVFDSPLPVEQDHNATVEVQDTEGNVVVEAVTVHEAFTGSGTESDPYRIHSWEQMELIAEDLDAHYLLANDLELLGIPRPQIGAEWIRQEGAKGSTRGPGAFTGTFDGGGHTISGFRSDGEIGGGRYTLGAGLFGTNAGTIHDLGVADARIEGGPRIGGLLADTNTGTIQRCWASGTIAGSARIGGLVGNSEGEIRDCYSTAAASTSATESGGVVGVGVADSTTERIYATGDVESGTNNAGGLMGYAYGGTVLRDSVALNSSVTATQSAHAVLGRYSGGTPTLEGNYAWEDIEVDGESYTVDPAPDNPKGGPATQDQIRSPEFYAETLSWDFDEVWEWNDGLNRPTLQGAPEPD